MQGCRVFGRAARGGVRGAGGAGRGVRGAGRGCPRYLPPGACEVRRWQGLRHKGIFKYAPGRAPHECTELYDHIIFNMRR